MSKNRDLEPTEITRILTIPSEKSMRYKMNGKTCFLQSHLITIIFTYTVELDSIATV